MQANAKDNRRKALSNQRWPWVGGCQICSGFQPATSSRTFVRAESVAMKNSSAPADNRWLRNITGSGLGLGYYLGRQRNVAERFGLFLSVRQSVINKGTNGIKLSFVIVLLVAHQPREGNNRIGICPQDRTPKRSYPQAIPPRRAQLLPKPLSPRHNCRPYFPAWQSAAFGS